MDYEKVLNILIKILEQKHDIKIVKEVNTND